jgi:glycosyltransferase involved in cell wall biosynthesis
MAMGSARRVGFPFCFHTLQHIVRHKEDAMIDVIIPARNEADTVADVIACLRVCDNVRRIFVVDSCSADDTAAVARQAGAFVITADAPGKGQAIAKGLEYATSSRVLLCDADLTPLPIRYVNRLARHYDSHAMIIGVPDFTPNTPWARPGGLWSMLSGVRSLPAFVLYTLLDDGLLFGYTVEVMINRVVADRGLPVIRFRMTGVKGKARWGPERKAQMDIDFAWLKARGNLVGRN